ncbi:MAG: hypothetical protein K5978_03670 [Campylobacter sp.]|nr:hypothetical protein [Campylobacter sp.]
MNDFFESLKDIKKEMIKEQGNNVPEKKQTVKAKTALSKDEIIANKKAQLQDEFLNYTKYADIRKI